MYEFNLASLTLTNFHLLLHPHRIEDAEAVAKAVQDSLQAFSRTWRVCVGGW
jgi:hypothetical protein